MFDAAFSALLTGESVLAPDARGGCVLAGLVMGLIPGLSGTGAVAILVRSPSVWSPNKPLRC